ncbi:MAG: FtsX-like permease family protein [Gammaproteobacteria bacterium]|nr:FtsX-like permease family protein [Gammaproteobacteria bacterium]
MLSVKVAWRNLWRNRRRTLLTAGAVGFAVLLVQLGMSFQAGSYEPMVEVSTRFASGHLQIQHVDYKDDPRTERFVSNTTELRSHLLDLPGINAVSNRTESFGLVNKDERSYGALVVGVDPQIDPSASHFSDQVTQGTYFDSPNSAIIGSALARNLRVSVGDEIVILSTDVDGSVAFIAPSVSGIFETGNDALDRSLVQVPRSLINDALMLEDSAHRVVIMIDQPMLPEQSSEVITPLVPSTASLLDWRELMPEISQSIRLDKISNGIVYGTLTVIVVLSIANTFVMTMFERTREFGTLRAVGMHNRSIFGMFITETILMWMLGVAIGYLLSTCALLPLINIGIGMDSMGMDQFAGLLFLPDRIYPAVDLKVVLVAPISIGVGMVLSTMLASIRLYRLSLVDALRYRE